jgi:hypothetical protein
MKEIKLNVAREIFRNIEMINDLSMLKEVELGLKGAAFYADCAQSAVYLGRKWQVFAAAVFFRVPRPWVQAVAAHNEEKMPGHVMINSTGSSTSRRKTSDKTNLAHFFAIGISLRYPKIDPQTIERVLRHPEILLQDGYLEAIQKVYPDIREHIESFIV